MSQGDSDSDTLPLSVLKRHVTNGSMRPHAEEEDDGDDDKPLCSLLKKETPTQPKSGRSSSKNRNNNEMKTIAPIKQESLTTTATSTTIATATSTTIATATSTTIATATTTATATAINHIKFEKKSIKSEPNQSQQKNKNDEKMGREVEDEDEDEGRDDDDNVPISKLISKSGTTSPKPPPTKSRKRSSPSLANEAKKKPKATPNSEKIKKEDNDEEKKPIQKKRKDDKGDRDRSGRNNCTAKKRKKKSSESDEAMKNGGDSEEEGEEGEEDGEHKWWRESEKLPPGVKWLKLEHNGVLFPPPYQPHGVRLLYNGKPVDLTPQQEEVATFYAQYLETDHTKKPTFRKNFFQGFLKLLNPKGSPKHIITSFEKCDFSLIHQHLMNQKEEKKNWSKERKQKEKEEKAKLQEKYGWAILDGRKQKIANYRVEPPGLFLGRGSHPKAGQLKTRIMPEHITINIGREANVPECPIPNHNWKAVIHDNTVTWLASWNENVNNQFKYVWFSSSSRIKGESDMKKFETARKLGKNIDSIRSTYMKELTHSDVGTCQRATALWLIDYLALRVGNEKGEDEADTVGCCSLRAEHLEMQEQNNIHFDFLGKDSMRYEKTVTVHEDVWKNLQRFKKGKKKDDELFDKLTTTALNAHLKEKMEGLTAKVFRTYNASVTLQKELNQIPVDKHKLVDEKVHLFNQANRQVAILCNHQRTVSKTHNEQMEKLNETLTFLQEQKQELQQHLKDIKSGKRKQDAVVFSKVPLPPPTPKKKINHNNNNLPNNTNKKRRKGKGYKQKTEQGERGRGRGRGGKRKGREKESFAQ